jgi:hypothetical protein
VRVKDIDSEDFRGFTVRGCRHINHGRKRKRLSMTSTPPTHCRNVASYCHHHPTP